MSCQGKVEICVPNHGLNFVAYCLFLESIVYSGPGSWGFISHLFDCADDNSSWVSVKLTLHEEHVYCIFKEAVVGRLKAEKVQHSFYRDGIYSGVNVGFPGWESWCLDGPMV